MKREEREGRKIERGNEREREREKERSFRVIEIMEEAIKCNKKSKVKQKMQENPQYLRKRNVSDGTKDTECIKNI